MPDHIYHCVNCGAPLTPDDVVIDVSDIAFSGAAEGDYSELHLYVSIDQMESMFSWDEREGKSNIMLLDWIRLLYEQCYDKLDPGTRAKNAEEAYRKYKELLEKQNKQEYSNFLTAIVPGLQDNLSYALTTNCGEDEHCNCTIVRNKNHGYTNVTYPGRPSSSIGIDHRRCPHCYSTLLEKAFLCEHRLVGFIGFDKVGKTCLIAALCKNRKLAAPGSAILLRPGDEPVYAREINRYENGFSLQKTHSNGLTKITPTIHVVGGKRPPCMITFVDIAGEAFSKKKGSFDPEPMVNNFRAISDCSLFIFCTSLAAFETAKDGCMQVSLESFNSYLEEQDRSRKLSPILIAVMQIDEPAKCVDEPKNPEYIGGEYCFTREINQITNLRERAQLRSAVPDAKLRSTLTTEFDGLIKSVETMQYYTPITCSAYGHEPVQQIIVYQDSAELRQRIEEEIAKKHPVQIVVSDITDERKLFETYKKAYGSGCKQVEIVEQLLSEQDVQLLREINAEQKTDGKDSLDTLKDSLCNNSKLSVSPTPRNLHLLYDWMLCMLGEKEIASYTTDIKPLPLMDCRGLSRNEFHINKNEVLAIARMFANPHEYDKKLYSILQESKLLLSIKKHFYLREIAKAGRKDGPLCQ